MNSLTLSATNPNTRDKIGMTVMAGVFVAGVLLLPSTQVPLALGGLVLLVTLSLLLEVELPWGGRVALGHAVVIAFAGRLSVEDFIVVAGLSLVLVTLPELRRYGLGQGALVVVMFALAAAAALVGREAGTALINEVSVGHRMGVVIPVVLAGVAYIGAIFALQALVPAVGGRARGWRAALNVYASLLCAAALLALASTQSPALGAVVLVPLLVLRFSFHRYFEARRTFLQTTQALAMIPEVAGLTPLGHAERVAVYAAALAEWMTFPPEQVALITTVARLHHIGQIAHPHLVHHPYGPYPNERRLLGESSSEILAETGFLHDVAPLVDAVYTAGMSELTEPVAIVRVASTLDDLVAQDASALPDAVVGLLARHDTGLERTVAIKLAQLCDAEPGLATRAVAAGAQLAAAGAGLSLAGSAQSA